MRGLRLFVLLLATLTVAISILYFQDPWLWRRFANTFIYAVSDQPVVLKPNEAVTGDDSFILPRVTPDERILDDVSMQAIADFVAGFDTDALIVLQDGKIQMEWYGEGLDRNSLTQSQSMHKTLLALLIGIALDEGRIGSIDEPIGRYIEAWQSDPRGDITIRELLTMSSGLAQYRFTLNPWADDFRWLYSGDTQPYVLRIPLAGWEPGTRFDYNNLNSELLGTVLEAAYGMRYAEILERKLWAPMGGGRALVWLDSEFGNAFTSCCLMATAMDWTRIGQLMLNRGTVKGRQIVPAAWIDAMTAPSPVSPWYGFQIWLAYEDEINPYASNPSTMGAYDRREPFLAGDVYYFSGRGAQRVYVVPSRKLVIVRLGPALGARPLKAGWDNAFLVNSVISSMK